MMRYTQLGYIGITASDSAAWRTFAGDYLGMQVMDGNPMIETGWAGRLIDVDRWVPELMYGPSIWGHERRWLPPERRAEAQAILETAAEKGILEPTSVANSPAFKLEDV